MSRVTQARGDVNQMPSMLGLLQSLKPTDGSQRAAEPRTGSLFTQPTKAEYAESLF